ncbi:hypothetical protein AB0F24_17135 [Streptomyces platensis]
MPAVIRKPACLVGGAYMWLITNLWTAIRAGITRVVRTFKTRTTEK